MKVLVTGGSGFLGRRLSRVKPEWVYSSSSDADLTSYEECVKYFNLVNPDAIVHLAARVGGIKDNSENPAEFYDTNSLINNNVIRAALACGVKRVLSSLSTCAFPDVVSTYPFTEEDILQGPPPITNLAYAFTKRALYIQTLAYREQYGVNYACFSPSNIYGPGDDFNSESSHFVPALLRRVAASEDGDHLIFWGTGEPMRQQLYVDDLAKIIPILLEKHNSAMPIIVAPEENLTIKEMIDETLSVLGEDRVISFNGKLDGQLRKDGSNEELLKLIGPFEFTSFSEGVRYAYNWYNNWYKNNEKYNCIYNRD